MTPDQMTRLRGIRAKRSPTKGDTAWLIELALELDATVAALRTKVRTVVTDERAACALLAEQGEDGGPAIAGRIRARG